MGKKEKKKKATAKDAKDAKEDKKDKAAKGKGKKGKGAKGKAGKGKAGKGKAGKGKGAKGKAKGVVMAQGAPAPVGAYPHARIEGDLLFLSGVGPRQPGTDAIPGGPIRGAGGEPRDYDAAAQTRATIENVKTILSASGSSLEEVVDVTAFLIDMDRDFKAYNAVYAEYFSGIQATRTTLAIRALPTPIAVELKVIARAPKKKKKL